VHPGGVLTTITSGLPALVLRDSHTSWHLSGMRWNPAVIIAALLTACLLISGTLLLLKCTRSWRVAQDVSAPPQVARRRVRRQARAEARAAARAVEQGADAVDGVG
jgi:hypothetical protein